MSHPVQTLLITLLSCVIPSAWADTLHLAVAANFIDVAHELTSRFEEKSGHRVKASFGSTGKLYAQIIHGAPFEIFLAADAARPQRLEEEGLAVAGSRFTYAGGRLVLWSAEPERFADGASYLQEGAFLRLAIANPETAPYGLAARQSLQHLGLWEALSPRLVRGDSIAQTFQFTATGNAEVGLVAAAQVKVWHKAGSVWEVPQDHYQPIEQQVVLLKRGVRNLAARDFLQFLRSEEAKTVIRDYGYAVE